MESFNQKINFDLIYGSLNRCKCKEKSCQNREIYPFIYLK